MISKKAWVEGCALGILLSVLSVVLLDVSDVTLLGAYTLVLLLVSASLTSSQRDGAFFGLFAVIGESLTDFAYFIFAYGTQALLVPYAVGFTLFVGRIPVFPLVGAIGGYLGRRYVAERSKSKLRATNRPFASPKTKGKEGKSGETRVIE